MTFDADEAVDGLRRMVAHDDFDGIVSFTADWSEKDRRAVRKAAKDWLDSFEWFDLEPDRFEHCQLAVLVSIGTPRMLGRESRRLSCVEPAEWHRGKIVPRATLVELITRRPPSYRRSLPAVLGRSSWNAIGPLAEAGLIDVDDDVAESLLHGMPGRGGDLEKSTARQREFLEGNPWLLDDLVWRAAELHLSPSLAIVLVQFAERGLVDRHRVLDLIVDRRNVKAHAAVDFTLDEKRSRARGYVSMIGSEDGGVARLGLSVCNELLDDGSLDASVDELSAGLFSPHKNVGMPSLALLRRLAAAGFDETEVAAVALAGLGHPHRDVQAATVQLLSDLRADPESVWQAADLVTPTVRSTIDDLFGPEQQSPTTTSADDPPLRELVAACPESLRPAATTLVDALEAGNWPIALRIPTVGPHRGTESAVEAPSSFEETVRLASLQRDWLEDPTRIEVVLDGISRFRDDRPDGFEALTEQLRRNCSPEDWDHPNVGSREALKLTWLDAWPDDETRRAALERTDGEPDGADPLRRRILDLEADIHGGGPARPLLALPSHPDGWIGSSTLVERYETAEPVLHSDLVQAVLRVNDPEALLRLVDAAHPLARTLDVLAAAITTGIRTVNAGPGLGVELEVTRLADPSEIDDTFLGEMSTYARADAPWVQPGGSVPALLDAPLAADSVEAHSYDGSMPWPSSVRRLIDPDQDLSPAGHLALAQSILSPQAAARRRGVDVLLATSQDGRVDDELLGMLIARTLDHDGARTSRLRQPFDELSTLSALTSWVGAGILDATAARMATVPNKVHALLEPWLECAAAAGRGPSDDARSYLEPLAAGSTKRAKLAKQLLAIDEGARPNGEAMRLAAEAARSRLRRWCSLPQQP